MKKILSLTLVLTLILGSLCLFSASAEHISAHKINCGDFWYAPLGDNTAAIGAVTSDLSGAVVIPETIDGYIVTEIANDGFSGAKITDITIPNTVTRLGEYSFSYCPNLKTVNIPNSVTTIDFCAFANCPKLTYMFVPGSVTYIGEAAIGHKDNYVDNDGVMLPDGGYVPISQMVIEGYNGTAAEKYARESHISFKGVTLYKDEVLSLLNIPEEDPDTGGGWLAHYSEEYYHYSSPDESGEATPDFALILAYENISGPAFVAKVFDEYIMRSSQYLYPATFGYHIYLPETNEIYSLEKAFKMGITGVYNLFTEGIIGELIGDVNYDDKLNIRDATLIQKHLAGIEKINRNEISGFIWSDKENVPFYIGDYNRDGKMNIRDATAIQKRIAGL